MKSCTLHHGSNVLNNASIQFSFSKQRPCRVSETANQIKKLISKNCILNCIIIFAGILNLFSLDIVCFLYFCIIVGNSFETWKNTKVGFCKGKSKL